MGARSTNPTQSFFDDFFRSGTDAVSPVPPEVFATGGTKSIVGSRTYHVFAAPNTTPVSQNFEVNAGTKKIIIVEYFSTNADVMFFFIIQKK